MAHANPTETHHSATSRRLPSPSLSTWIALMAVAKLADGVTTLVGLHLGYAEGNPFTAAIIAMLGPVVGVAAALTAAIVAVVIVAEGLRLGLARLSAPTAHQQTPRLVGYGLTVAAGVVAAAWNIGIIGGFIA